MERILGKCVKKNLLNTVHIVFWVAAMTYVQCFVLYFREEGPRAVTALYFGWPAFRSRHFVIWGGGGGIIFIPVVRCGAPLMTNAPRVMHIPRPFNKQGHSTGRC